MKFRHLFGPVASRRLGVSLGVDLVVHKVCSMDCVYCECGRTTDLTDRRRAWVAFERVTAELDRYLEENEDPDYITFSGSGEPCLNSDLGRVIRYIKGKRPRVKVAVLTNATLLQDPAVREELALADLVVPSLDGVSDAVFQKINRPHAAFGPQGVIQGIREFSKGFSGRVHLEVFILPGVNDTPEELALIKAAIAQIRPHLVQINSLDRPGTQEGIRPADRAALEKIREFLGPDQVEIIARLPEPGKGKRRAPDLEAAVLETIHRRPCTCQDLADMLGAEPERVQALLDRLGEKGSILARQEDRGIFYQTKKS